MIKNNLEKLRHIFLYYDSEPMEILQSLVWIFLLFPMTIIESGFNAIIHIPMIMLPLSQLFIVLNYSLNARKIISFVLFLITLGITLQYMLSGMIWVNKSFVVFLFNSFFAFFNLKRLTIENIRKK